MFKLFEKRNKSKENRFVGRIYATQDGTLLPLTEVPDGIISAGILGQGVAIVPHSGRVVAPVDGTVAHVAAGGHAFCFQTSDGVELLVHIGVDTVKLHGQGFRVHVKKGDYVLAGAPVCDVDLALLAARNLPACTAILISNPADFQSIVPDGGEVTAGTSTIIHYQAV